MTNWSETAEIAKTAGGRHPRFEELKELPILYVLERANVEYEEVGGIYKAKSPFRADSNPSFDVYGEEFERWGDYAEGTSGDVIDLLERMLAVAKGTKPTIGEVKDWAAKLLSEYKASGWQAPVPAERRTFDLEAAKAYVENVQATEPHLVYDGVFQMLQKRTDRFADADPRWLADTFRLGWDGERVMIPYYDQLGDLVVYKTRRPGQPVFSAAGATHTALYGEWLDNGTDTVVLCEGESDVWSGTHAALPGYVFLGLPTGAGSKPKQAYRLAGRRVIIALDGDPAGRKATTVWSAALAEIEGTDVLVGYVPDNMDLAKLSPSDIELILESAMPSRLAPADAPVALGRTGMERPGKIPVQISDWVFEPEQVLLSDDGTAWEGIVWPQGKRTTMRAGDLSSKPRITAWAQANGGSWFGTDRDAQLLAALLTAKSTLLPRGRAVPVAGLHGDMIVYPGGTIGNANYVYVPGKVEVPLGSMVHLEESKVGMHAPGVPLRLRELHTPAVMDPILAWLAIAPLRSRIEVFPILAVTGAAGTGKTTLVKETLRHFTATAITANLTGTTKFAVLAYVGSTNAFPVWFDEYRPGARKETLAEFNQILRDAYTGQASIKGGMGDSWAAVREVAVTAPIIVSGEDAFSETSHTERMVLVHLPKNGRNTEAMPHALAADTTSFAAEYLDWVRLVEPPVIVPTGPEHLPLRNRYNIGVLAAGWNLLRSFLGEHGYELSDPDWSLIIEEAAEAAESSPILEAVQWALEDERLRMDHVVFELNGEIHVRVTALVAAAQRSGVFTLPGGAKAVGKYLKSQLGATEQSFRINGGLGGEGTPVRTWSFPAEVLSSTA